MEACKPAEEIFASCMTRLSLLQTEDLTFWAQTHQNMPLAMSTFSTIYYTYRY